MESCNKFTSSTSCGVNSDRSMCMIFKASSVASRRRTTPAAAGPAPPVFASNERQEEIYINAALLFSTLTVDQDLTYFEVLADKP